MIASWSADQAAVRIDELCKILVDCVEGGASVNFMRPYGKNAARKFWEARLPAIAEERVVLFVGPDEGPARGTVQLLLDTPPNQTHRAEITKLLVHREARGQGLGRALVTRAEDEARRRQRSLLTFDTVTGSVAEKLYLGLGFTKAGVIPGYARMPEGPLADTSLFYKWLDGVEPKPGAIS